MITTMHGGTAGNRQRSILWRTNGTVLEAWPCGVAVNNRRVAATEKNVATTNKRPC